MTRAIWKTVWNTPKMDANGKTGWLEVHRVLPEELSLQVYFEGCEVSRGTNGALNHCRNAVKSVMQWWGNHTTSTGRLWRESKKHFFFFFFNAYMMQGVKKKKGFRNDLVCRKWHTKPENKNPNRPNKNTCIHYIHETYHDIKVC